VSQRPRTVHELVICATIALAAIGIAPAIAEAQSTGMLQVTATVVKADNAFRTLDEARAALRIERALPGRWRANGVPTVARIAIMRNRRAIVVTIDYSRN
jgi:hypothetical protein